VIDRTFLLIGAIAGFLGVAFGAFAAHGLRGRIAPDMLAVFETGARYQMYHALALLVIAVMRGRTPSNAITAAGWFFTAGIVLFSGSLYLVATTGVARFGAITPIGGLALLGGWLALALAAL
jgi:uncharacterized membrane protein YgdD (TMEM256/DUF423 family)